MIKCGDASLSTLSPNEIALYWFTLILFKVDKLMGGVVRGLAGDARYAAMKIVN